MVFACCVFVCFVFLVVSAVVDVSRVSKHTLCIRVLCVCALVSTAVFDVVCFFGMFCICVCELHVQNCLETVVISYFGSISRAFLLLFWFL